MTVLAVEGAETAAGSSAATGSSAAQSRAATRSRTARGPQGPRGNQGPAGRSGKIAETGPAYAPPDRRQRSQRKPSGKLGTGKNHQPAILAEFIAAIILVAATPFATTKNPEGLSPYVGTDVVKLTAITFTYLLLALVSSAGPKAGKMAALFGLLILLALGLNEAANLVVAFDLFAGIPVVSGKRAAK